MNTFTPPIERANSAAQEMLGPIGARPRLAYVVSLFPCWSETFIAEEIQELIRQGFEITIFSLRPECEPHVHELARSLLARTLYADSFFSLLGAQLYFLVRKPGAYVKRFSQMFSGAGWDAGQLGKLLATFFLSVHFARVVQKKGIERIHAHWATYPATAAWIIELLTGTPYSFTTHAHDLFLADRLLVKKCEQASFIVTISEYNRRLLKELGADANKIHVIHCGVDTRKFVSGVAKRKPGYILCVGRLAPIKGMEVLLEACRLLVQQRVEFFCEIVGEGPLARALQQQIDGSNLGPYVRLSGFASQEEVKKKLAEAALFVLPSRRTENGDQDGIPVALMEAMAMGVPVVSTAVSGIPELIKDGINGTLVPPDNAQRLAEAIKSGLQDAEKSAFFTQRAYQTVAAEFDIAKNAQRLGQLLMEPK